MNSSMHERHQELQIALRPYFKDKFRTMPWRELEERLPLRFYKVLVSEMMLQQTQVARVEKKFHEWMSVFPTIETLAQAPLVDVLRVWQGLGYSRRAKYLHDCAQAISATTIPVSVAELAQHKGIGQNTAGAIIVYTYNHCEIFIETNIRTVLFHHFFDDHTDIDDSALRTVLAEALDKSDPRLWYWAMMDYGSDLKKSIRNIHKSKHYRKQSVFEGSDRQLRSRFLREVIEHPLSASEAIEFVGGRQDILDALVRDGLLYCKDGHYLVANT